MASRVVSENGTTPKIQKLDEVVVNRIAAGEVIQRPANAIKEMIENSLDAKSKSIQVTVRNGGLKLLQIQDDGCGIRKDDMGIVCERFTTSKLSSFEDLKSISTYGFRGEALASISHVAHLTITTKTADSSCAYKAKYEDGKMVALQPGGKVEPKPCAGNKGTQITVEDLFYNVAVRRKALKNANEEHAKITDVISKYSIHNPTVGFSLKKFGQNIADVRTAPASTVVDNIKAIYGPTVSRELLEVLHTDEKLGFKLAGYITNANYSMKKCTMLLFINHRLVDSTSLRKALDAVYVNYLPKDKHPFMYISLELNPLNLDVNVHPTKHEVKFLHEEMIIESIQKCVETKLLGANESRQYYTQTLLPKMVSAAVECPLPNVVSEKPDAEDSGKKKLYAHQMVRTDAREQKIQAFFPHLKQSEHQQEDTTARICINKASEINHAGLNVGDGNDIEEIREDRSCTNQNPPDQNNSPDSFADWNFDEDMNFENQLECKIADKKHDGELHEGRTESPSHSQSSTISDNNSNNNNISKSDITNKPNGNSRNVPENISCNSSRTMKRKSSETAIPLSKVSLTSERQIRLTSVKNLCKAIDQKEHLGLKNLLNEHKFVGCVNRTLALVQHLTQLYLVNTQKLTQELFYQILIFKFGNFGYIELSEAAPIYELVLLALNSPESGWSPEDGSKEDLAKYATDLLMNKAEMLLDYFSVEINKNGELTAVPLLLDNYIPNWNGLPMLLLRLATEVDWHSEEECFHSFALELSHFYAFGPDPLNPDESEEEEKKDPDISGDVRVDNNGSDGKNNWRHVVEHMLYPILRTSIVPPKEFSTDGTFLEVANLPDLYKVFERC